MQKTYSKTGQFHAYIITILPLQDEEIFLILVIVFRDVAPFTDPCSWHGSEDIALWCRLKNELASHTIIMKRMIWKHVNYLSAGLGKLLSIEFENFLLPDSEPQRKACVLVWKDDLLFELERNT